MRCYISAYDANTGKQLWKFNTIAQTRGTRRRHVGQACRTRTARAARPGSPAATIRTSISTYCGSRASRSPGCPRAAVRRVFDAALYAIVHACAQRRQRHAGVALPARARRDRSISTRSTSACSSTSQRRNSSSRSARPAVLWKLDRTNGKFIGFKGDGLPEHLRSDRSDDRACRGIASDIVEQQGRASGSTSCPSTEGGHNWQAMSYHQPTGVLIIPLSQSCMEMCGTEGRAEGRQRRDQRRSALLRDAGIERQRRQARGVRRARR